MGPRRKKEPRPIRFLKTHHGREDWTPDNRAVGLWRLFENARDHHDVSEPLASPATQPAHPPFAEPRTDGDGRFTAEDPVLQPHARDTLLRRGTVSPQDAFAPIRRIGGDRGWYYANWLWQLRGLLDRLFGGVGLRRGRRDPDSLRVGDTVDFWRVEAMEPDRRLRLAAEMKLPGRAWLEFEVTRDTTGSVIRQTATFDAKGLLGRAYWYSVFPLHQFVFGGMIQSIAAEGQSKG